MKRLLILLCVSVICFGAKAQTAKDVNIVIQKTLDLHELKDHYSEDEKEGSTPLIIINDEKIPDNLILFKFNKRVKIMTENELKTFKQVYSGDLSSYFVFDTLQISSNEAKISAKFREGDKIPISVKLEKRDNQWYVTESKAGKS